MSTSPAPANLFMQVDDSGIWIPGEVPSSKNTQQIKSKFAKSSKWFLRVKGRFAPVVPYITKSEFAKEYEIVSKSFYVKNRKKFKEQIEHLGAPYYVKFTFYRRNNQTFDYNNIGQMVQDMMVNCEWLPDDNCNYLIPLYGVRKVEPSNPGVFIQVINPNNEQDRGSVLD